MKNNGDGRYWSWTGCLPVFVKVHGHMIAAHELGKYWLGKS
jgi:hypothetical protein